MTDPAPDEGNESPPLIDVTEEAENQRDPYVGFRVDPVTRRKIDNLCKMRKMTLSQLFEDSVEQLCGEHDALVSDLDLKRTFA